MNSSDSLLTIHLSRIPEKDSRIDLYNAAGKLLKKIAISEQETAIDVGTFTPGLYLLIINSGKKIDAVRFQKK